MSIVIIKGKPETGKTLIANALRNNQINNKHGALLIDELSEGDTDILLEKIIVGVNVPTEAPKDLNEIPWKPNAMVILIGEKSDMLDVFEERLPGFKKHFSPIYTIDTDKI
jgi:hypothetical protein